MNQALKSKLGQRFAIGFSGTTVTDELRDIVREYEFGNFILFRENLVSTEQTRTLCRELHELAMEVTGIPPLIAIDQEGGMVTRLAEDELNIPGAMALAATGDPERIREFNELNGRLLRDLGFNFNLAPVADVNTEPDNPVIGVRSYGDTAEQVADYAQAAFEGLRAGGVLGAAKHFPGHGDTTVDSHVGLPRVDKTREELEAQELLPFRQLAAAQVDAIMTTHILFPELEPERVPATMSEAILTGLLREDYGYEGLIVSDCMEMDAIVEHYGTVEGVLESFRAGVDLVFISHTPQLAVESFETVYQAYASGELLADALEASYARLMQAKVRLAEPISPLEDADRAAAQARIRAILPATYCAVPADKPLQALDTQTATVILGPAPYRATNVSNEAGASLSFARDLGKQLGLLSLETSARPSASEIQQAVQQTAHAEQVILGLYNAHVFTEQLALWRALRDAGRTVLPVALRNPYDLMYLSEEEQGLAIFEYTPKSLASLADVLAGRALPTGHCPVALERRVIP